MKPSAIFPTMQFGAALLLCSFAVLALLLCVLCAILSPFLDDPKGPGPMDIHYSLLAWAFGFLSLVTGMFGFFILVIAKGIKKKTPPHPNTIPN
jgi:hypothetical protein